MQSLCSREEKHSFSIENDVSYLTTHEPDREDF